MRVNLRVVVTVLGLLAMSPGTPPLGTASDAQSEQGPRSTSLSGLATSSHRVDPLHPPDTHAATAQEIPERLVPPARAARPEVVPIRTGAEALDYLGSVVRRDRIQQSSIANAPVEGEMVRITLQDDAGLEFLTEDMSPSAQVFDTTLAFEVSRIPNGWSIRGTTRRTENSASGWSVIITDDGTIDGGQWARHQSCCGSRQRDMAPPTAIN